MTEPALRPEAPASEPALRTAPPRFSWPVDWLCRTAHLRAMALEIPVTPHGDCEYCAGGSGHAHLADAATRLRLGAQTSDHPPQTIARDGNLFLRVVNVPATSGCGSCGPH